MSGDEKVPEELVREMIARLECESNADWTEEFGASGGKTTSLTTILTTP